MEQALALIAERAAKGDKKKRPVAKAAKAPKKAATAEKTNGARKKAAAPKVRSTTNKKKAAKPAAPGKIQSPGKSPERKSKVPEMAGE
jgi:DNA topoisomerase-1